MNDMPTSIRIQHAGFSLLELVITMVLIALMAAMAMQPILQAIQARAAVTHNLSAIDTLRYATERIVRELRQVRFDAQGSGFQLTAKNPIPGAGNASSGLCFIRVGGSNGNSYSTLAILQNSTSVTLDQVSYPGCAAIAPHMLADRASALRFDYWSYGSSSMPVLLATNDVNFGTKLAFIDVTLSVTPAGGTAISYRSRVVLRNGAWGAAK
jgi:prepilin-type N-terminal cleavage/methylation domain-containing protein